MKKLINKFTEEELKNYPLKDIVAGWHFRIEELSQGHYLVKGIDNWGRSIARDGIDPEEILKICKKDIIEMFSNRNNIGDS